MYINVFQVGTTVSARVGEAGVAASEWSKGLQATITDLKSDSMHKIQGYRCVLPCTYCLSCCHCSYFDACCIQSMSAVPIVDCKTLQA
jgi:hypothetical protein